MGVDKQTAEEYAEDLGNNLKSLLERAKSGRYVAPPVRRAHIPKDSSGKELRPIGVPTFEDRNGGYNVRDVFSSAKGICRFLNGRKLSDPRHQLLRPFYQLLRALRLYDQTKIRLGIGLPQTEPPTREIHAYAVDVGQLTLAVFPLYDLDDSVLFLNLKVDLPGRVMPADSGHHTWSKS